MPSVSSSARRQALAFAAARVIALRRRPAHVESRRAAHTPYDYQVVPWSDSAWDMFALVGGRGAGKTETGARAVNEYAEANPGVRIGVGAPTIGDARFTCAEGPAGLITTYRDNIRSYNRSLGEAWYKNGTYVRFLGSEEPDRWNGPEFDLIWADELALWKQASWEQAEFTLRAGPHPRAIITTTPKRKKWVKDLIEGPGVVMRRVSMLQNVNLAESFRNRILRRYEGTRLGRQEIEGEFVLDVEGALWSSDWIDDNRVRAVPEGVDIVRLVVAIDPAVTATDASDQTGIAIVGVGSDGEYYVFYCYGWRESPRAWARRALDLYEERLADLIVGEVNNGGDLVETTIRTVAQDRPIPVEVHFQAVHASRGKVVRAEPIAALYEQGRVHHVGRFADAEEQATSFPIENDGDDMVDSLVWGMTACMTAPRRWGPAGRDR